MKMRTQLKAGKIALNHNEGLRVRSSLKAGKLAANHNEALQVRSAIKAGGWLSNHNETLRCDSDRPLVLMRQQIRTTARKEDRLELLVVRAGLRAGKRFRGYRFGRGRA